MPKHDIFVVGGSAGALDALIRIVELLPHTFAGCVLIVLHMRADSDGMLTDILRRNSKLPVSFARDHTNLGHGHIYLAPPDRHLLASASGMRVVHGPRENGFRPAVDPLFRTAARAFGPRVVGVVLSGALSDGTYGLSVIKHNGGIAVVQDPKDALVDSMPRHALEAVDVDYVEPAAEIAALMMRLNQGQQPAEQGEGQMARKKDLEPQLPSEETAVEKMEDHYGAASSLTCPDCGGALWEVEEGRVVRYQCHVGHQFAPDSLEAGQRDAVDSALWSAVRVLEEHAELKARMARRAEASGLKSVADGFTEGAHDAHKQAQTIRSVLFSVENGNAGAVATTQRSVAEAKPRRKIRRTKNKK